MKQASILVALSLVLNASAIGHNGYTHDPLHSLEHKEDLEKLIHPNHEIHIVQQRRAVKEVKNVLNADGPSQSREVLMMGLKDGYVRNRKIDNVVTNILEASAAIELESVLKFHAKK